MEVVAAALARGRVGVDARRREDPLPGPLAAGVRVLPGEGAGEGHVAGAALEVGEVLALDALQVRAQGRDEPGGQDGHPVLSSLSVADDQLLAGEVHVLDAQAAALQQAEAGPVHQGRHEPRRTAHAAQHGDDLVAGEHHGQALRQAGARHLVEPRQLAAEDLAVEEEKGAERLVLGGGADLAPRGEVAEVPRHLGCAEAVGVPLPVKEDEAADPGDVRVLGAAAEVPGAQDAADAVEEPGGRGDGGRLRVHASPPTPAGGPAQRAADAGRGAAGWHHRRGEGQERSGQSRAHPLSYARRRYSRSRGLVASSR